MPGAHREGNLAGDDGKTCILFEDIPSTDENSQAFQDLVRRTGGTGMMLPVKVENKGYEASPSMKLLEMHKDDLAKQLREEMDRWK